MSREWISIETRKPKLDEDVLITDGRYVISARIVEKPDYTEFGRPIKQWWTSEATEILDSEYGCGHWLVDEMTTTHWMPLPEPPEVSSE